ncbi:hypothetical protein [Streptomyces sp. DSM 40750]|uniref:hypothetical protein n=1 Tax=Streptomyces sp. DSM 40750 TaxID=2801030 RepID=UPI00214B5250|nr:hypothetical protein [Streptomyces sp. DSM 40750]UUU22536.1 hypothetical protein JIX55_20775 [Streptomyces sp. DSM 40750]
MGLKNSFLAAAGGASKMQKSISGATSSLQRIQNIAKTAAASVGSLKNPANQAAPAVGRVKSNADRTASSLVKLKTSATQGGTGLSKLRSEANGLNTGVGKAKGGSDKLKSSLDKLKSSADKTKTALQGVKKQADAVEKSVGKAGKNADKGGKSMGNLGKGLKGASLAQKGLNLAMAASPFGLIMTLLAPLIAQFVNMDKVAALVKRGLVAAWSAIKSASSSAAKMLGPLFKGVVNGFMLPSRMLIRGLNALIGSLNRVKIKVPDWVPVIGGKGFQFNLPTLPVPQLAKGGIVQARSGGTLALLGEAGEHEAVIPLSKLERMLGSGGGLRTLASAVERLADRPVVIQVDSQQIARAVFLGQRQLARR